mmetsp:Transcript_45234/g.74020  ORF Transcript_45234/g.74020 Transcript_45234/m.74020 type:complete len:86 (-) Transcript_45234:1961-2218(-)
MNHEIILQNIQRQKLTFHLKRNPKEKQKNTRVIAYLYFHSRNAQLQTNNNCTQHDDHSFAAGSSPAACKSKSLKRSRANSSFITQ